MLNHSPSTFPPEVHARIVIDLQPVTVDAVAFGKQVELNLFRLQRGSPLAQSEEIMKALRLDKFHAWSQVLEEVEREVERCRIGVLNMNCDCSGREVNCEAIRLVEILGHEVAR